MNEENRKFLVVGLGEILWDVLPDGKQLGGAPANFAYHSHVLGVEGVVVSCVGQDELGKEILESLTNLGLSTDYIAIDAEHPTGTVTVELDSEGNPEYTIHEDAAWDFIPSTPELRELAAKADAVCFGSLSQRSRTSQETVRQFLEATHSGCIRVYDINLRQQYYSKEIIDDMLTRAEVLKLNDEELPVVASLLGIKGEDNAVLGSILKRYGLRLIVLTRGGEGSLLFGDGEISICRSSDSIEIADTVGAGDAFTAAVTAGLLRGKKLDEINKFANRLAGFVCTQVGATPKAPESLSSQI
ncbi:MAG: carbohydrate kinase [Planctomycetota bacterium]|nr:MAG: carbohydrate kinase [Planctomycetota bacterium]